MTQELIWPEAIRRVLEQESEPIHYAAIAEAIAEQGLRQNLGATPKDTVSSVLSTSINTEGQNSPFVRVSRGYYALRDTTNAKVTQSEIKDGESHPDTGLINAFGMYWDRARVEWKAATPKILGQQTAKSDTVDFAPQSGVYLLHDRREVVYVGQASAKSLAARLRAHTEDRLSGRWDRFSWFGVLPVHEQGALGVEPTGLEMATIITTMEALLIEGLEPRQNRKRGDDFNAIEFLQVTDPAIEKQRLKLQVLNLITSDTGTDS